MTAASNTDERTSLIEEMCSAAEAFYRAGWVFAHSGNMSFRLGNDTFLISTTGSHLGRLSADDFVDVDADGSPLDDSEQGPSQDTPLHLTIYDNVDNAGAVFHVHHLEAALCSDRDNKRGFTHLHDIRMIHALGIEGDEPKVNIPIVKRADVDTFTETLQDTPEVPCLNVENHGIYVWGQTPQDARRHVEALAYLFEYSWQRPMNPKKSTSITGF